MTYTLTLERVICRPDGDQRLYWRVPPSGVGRWVNDITKAKIYVSERAAHIAWTAVSKRYPAVRCLPVGEKVDA